MLHHPVSPSFKIALGLAVMASTALAQTAFEDRLAALERTVQTLRQENADLRRDLGANGTAGIAVVRPAGKAPVLAINGLVQTQAERGDKGDSRGAACGYDRFRLRRVRLGVAGRFLEGFDFKVEGEYVGSGVTLTDGFLNWNEFGWANLRAGQFKTPFGYEFLAADPKLFTIERTLGSDWLTLNRQVGVQAAGDFLEKRLSYAVGVFNGTGQNVATNDNDQFLHVGRVSATPWQGKLLGGDAKWTAGVDGYSSRDTALTVPVDFGFTGNSFTGRRQGLGVDSQLSVGRFDLWAEYLHVRFDPTGSKPNPAVFAAAWYLQGTYFLISKRLQAVLKYDDFDPKDKKVADDTSVWTIGANWFIKGDDLKLQIDYVRTELASLADHQNQLWLRAQVIF